MNILKYIIDYIFPFRCSICSELTDSSNSICIKCWPKFHFITNPYCTICGQKFTVDIGENAICARCLNLKPQIAMTRSLLEFSSDTKNLVYKFKYKDNTSLAKFFAKLIYNNFKNDLKDVDFLVPVPMHKIKRIIRNYNPPQILAYELSKYLQKPMIPNLLLKKRMTKNQVGLNRQQRAQNLSGSFGVNKQFDLKNKVILLVDDVLTTGATSSECSKILKKHKVNSVKLVTIARVSLDL